MPDMDKKAANKGDRLKHALLLEVLREAQSWEHVAFAETHAGAGVYCACRRESEHYIVELRKTVLEKEAPTEPGAACHEWRHRWWDDPTHARLYPGSALAALRWLEGKKPGQFELRLTEKEKATTNDSWLKDCVRASHYAA